MHVRIDSIERAVRLSGLPVVSLDDAGYQVGYAVAEDNLRLGHIVVADSVNPLPVTRDAWLAVAKRAGVTAVEVEIECSDRSEHRRRVEERTIEGPGLSGPSWEEVISREYGPWDRARVVIDTAACPVEQCVAMIVSTLPAGPDVGESCR